MSNLYLILTALVLVFGLVVFIGAPYLPSKKKPAEKIIKALKMDARANVLELGSGDGAVQLLLAKRGIASIGFEINPILVLVSMWRLRKYPIAQVKWANYWTQPIPEDTTHIYAFLHTRFMGKLDAKINTEATHPLVLISYAFAIPGREAMLEKYGYFVYSYSVAKGKKNK